MVAVRYRKERMGGVYNQDNRILVYHADCLIMMDKMFQSGMQVDCIATDSPYLINVTKDRLDGRFTE